MQQSEESQGQSVVSRLSFQQQVDSLAHHLIGLLVVSGVQPIVAAMASSQIIRYVLLDLVKDNREIARALLEEMARGLVEFSNELFGNDDEGQTKQ